MLRVFIIQQHACNLALVQMYELVRMYASVQLQN